MKLFAFPSYISTETFGNLPCWYEMADSSMLTFGKPFFIPDTDSEFSATPAVVVKISRLGKSIPERFARRYFQECSLAFCMRDEKLLSELRPASLPWTPAVSFDYCAPVGNFIPAERFMTPGEEIVFSSGDDSFFSFNDSSAIEASVCRAISRISECHTLKTGDLLFLCFPDSETILRPGRHLSGTLSGEKILFTKIK